MVEWGGHHGGWGGFGPPSYIVKKCPEYQFRLVSAPDNAVYGWADQNIFLQRVYSLGILFFRMKKVSYCSSVRPDN
jgi:hypothetical protein